MRTHTEIDGTCKHCGMWGHEVYRCPRVAAIEFHADGMIKRVEYVQPQPLTAPPEFKPLYGSTVGQKT